MLFCAKAFLNADKIQHFDNIVYNYRSVDTSVTHSTDNQKKSRDDIEAVERLHEYVNNNEDGFLRFLNYRHQIAALRFLTEIDVFSIDQYNEYITDKKAYKDLKDGKHRILCWFTNKRLVIAPILYNKIKKAWASFRAKQKHQKGYDS